MKLKGLVLILLLVACKSNPPSLQVLNIYDAIDAGYKTIAFLVTNDKIKPADAQVIKDSLDEAKAYADQLYGYVAAIRAERGPDAEPTEEEWAAQTNVRNLMWHAYGSAMTVLRKYQATKATTMIDSVNKQLVVYGGAR